jgi:transcriptional regulator with XRE-family HTH domain
VPPRRRSTPRSPAQAALGDAIREKREDLGYSQEELADATPMHITYLGGLERGVRNPSYETLLKLASALGTTPGALLTTAERQRRRHH